MRRFAGVTAVATVLLLASADRTFAAGTNLGPIGFGTMLVDNADNAVFVSAPKANAVKVLNFSGEVVATIGGIDGAYGMALSGGNLYVAGTTFGGIVEVHLPDLTTSELRGAAGIKWLTVSGTTLWATRRPQGGCCWSALASMRLNGRENVRLHEQEYIEPQLASSPSFPNQVFVVEESSPGTVLRLRIGRRRAKVLAETKFGELEIPEGLALSSNGQLLLAPDHTNLEELNAETLKPDGVVYDTERTEGQPSAAAYSQSDLLAAGVERRWYSTELSPDVAVYAVGKPAPIFEATTEPWGVLRDGIGISEDGTTVFAASEASNGDVVISTFAVS
ncbi:MAG TPA: hypothetical protein VMB51_15050 [Solirubrobacteraceae bacterium]|nr:hypothetical protein [Solirubrobacteraceae bacterium]